MVTGGAIKITEKMQQHPETVKQLEILKQCKNFLKENQIEDLDSLLDYIEN